MPLPSTDKVDGGGGHPADHNLIVSYIQSLEARLDAADAAEVTNRNAAIAAAGTAGSIWFNVKSSTYGAVGDGTTNDTTAVNAAITAAAAAGGVVWFPVGEYSLSNVTWKAGVRYLGVKGKSILKIRTGAAYLGSCDSGSSSAFVSDMHFEGLTFRGRIDTDTVFDQQRHLLNLNGVADVTIVNNEFIGWHGDAIYLGSSNSGGVERHNKRVLIADNFFDGLTKNNRNCVSIIDGEDITIKDNVATRFSRNDMPGFVDVEPNSANTFAICRRIQVTGNKTTDHNQNFFQMNLPGATYTNNICDMTISNNIDDAGASNTNTRFSLLMYARTTTTDTSYWNNIKFSNNICRNVYAPFELEGGIVGVEITDNTFENCAGASILGYWNNICRHVKFERNQFVNCAQTDGNVFRVNFMQDTLFADNHFQNCGPVAGGGNIINFSLGQDATCTSDRTDYISNRISGTRTSAISTKGANHTVTPANNLKRAYRENGLTFNVNHFATTV